MCIETKKNIHAKKNISEAVEKVLICWRYANNFMNVSSTCKLVQSTAHTRAFPEFLALNALELKIAQNRFFA